MTVTQEIKRSRPLRIFLSSASKDRELARRVRSILSLQPNLQLFTVEELVVGGRWVEKLRLELSECDVFMVLMSPNSIASDWVLQEIGAAWGLKKPIIPIVTHPQLAANLPLPVSHYKSVTMTELEDPETLHRILERFDVLGSSGADKL